MRHIFATAVLHLVVMIFLAIYPGWCRGERRPCWEWSHHCIAEGILAGGYLLIAIAMLSVLAE